MDTTKQKHPELWRRIYSNLVTFVIFVWFVSSIPLFLLLYFVVRICRHLWFRRLEKKQKDLELMKHTSVRTAMDTYRYQGVVSVLLQVKGQIDIDLVKQQITTDVIEKKKPNGDLRFPHMKMSLRSYWGRYAWEKDTSMFNLDNHVILVASPMIRNRPVTSANIQEYISDAVSKYIPPWNKIPPWQLLIVVTEPDKFYILARLHHLYISEDGITFGDLLMIRPDSSWTTDSPKQDVDSIENILSSIFKKPAAIPSLYEKTCDFLSNSWNEIVSVYDPTENPYILKEEINNFQFCIMVVVATVATFKESSKLPKIPFSEILKKEFAKRHITTKLYFRTLLNTANPVVIFRLLLTLFWWILFGCLFQIPILFANIIYDTPAYLRLLVVAIRAITEAVYLFQLAYTAPRVVLEELILPMFQLPKHHLQKVSLCGRKVVNWTEPIPIDLIRSIRDKTGAASCEIQLYGVSSALHEYFQKLGLQEPDTILTTTRFIPEENLLKSANNISSGLLCLSLPMKMPSDDPIYGLHLIQMALQEAMTTQTALYLASQWQYDYGVLTTVFPSIVARIMLYVLSTRYCVMMTQIEAHTKELQKRNLIWGQEVEAFIFWRPPQANISLSISLISYGDEMRFAIMTDAELAPEYNMLVTEYVSRINLLAQEAEHYSSLTATPGADLQQSPSGEQTTEL